MYAVFKVAVICSLLQFSESQNVVYPGYIFLGPGQNKQLFAISHKRSWSLGMDYCYIYGFRPGSILTDWDHTTVSQFLSNRTDFPEAEKSLWVSATDYAKEGTFRWLVNQNEVTVGNWSAGMPSIDRNANCLVINQDSLYVQVPCVGDTTDAIYYTLCELPNLRGQNTGCEKLTESNAVKKSQSALELIVRKTPVVPMLPKSLKPIGGVGTKLFFVNEDADNFWTSVEFCHQIGMRLADLESLEEVMFVRNYSSGESMNGRESSLHIAATDIMSDSCSISNPGFRWLYSGEVVSNETPIESGGSVFGYSCAYANQNGLYSSICHETTGIKIPALCELDTSS